MKTGIVILTDENFPYGGPGGNYLRNFSTGIALSSKYQVKVWLQSGNSRASKTFINSNNSIRGVNYKNIGAFSIRPKSGLGKMFDDVLGIINPIFLILKEWKQIKVFIVYNSTSIKTILPLILCKMLKINTIRILPEWYDKDSIVTSWIKHLKWWDFIFSMTKLNFFYDGLIVFSYYLKDYYVSHGYPENKLILIPNLVNFEEFHPQKEKQELNSMVIGYSGSPVKKDGILDLLKAFALLLKVHTNVVLLIIGDISQTKSAIPFLKKRAKELGIPENRIRFTGLIDFRQVPSILNSCDIFVVARPSGQFAEAGFPTKLGEYLSCKKPVVMTKVGDIPKYFTDKFNAVLVEPDDPESITNGFNYLIENPTQAKLIANEGFKWVESNLEYKMAISKFLKFLELNY